MTQKFDNFVRALNALCEEHEVQIAASEGIGIFDMAPGDDPVDGVIEDWTAQPQA
jgi:hypothetical protein